LEDQQIVKDNTASEKSIAVLPFVNMSSDNANEYLADGITEEIINGLSKINQLKVTSRRSAFFFKDKSVPLSEIAETLGVEIILEGSIRVAGTQMRISAQLIDANEDVQFWSETWDRKMENLFELQDEISLLIADKLRENLGHLDIEDHLVETKTKDIEAYNLSLKARFLFNNWNPNDVRESIDLFEKALSIDPNFTDAHIGLADAYSFLATTQFMSPEEAWRKSVEYTHSAYALDPKNAGVHYLLANLSFFTDCNLSEAYTHTQTSLELKPSYPEAQQYMVFLSLLSGEEKKASHHLQMALGIDPLNPETLFYKGYYTYRRGKYQDAITIFDDLLKSNPQNLPALITKLYSLIKLEQYDEVLRNLDAIPEELVIPQEKLGLTCLAYIGKKEQEKIEAYLKELEVVAQEPYAFQAHSYLMIAYAQLEKFDEAFQLIKRMIGLKSSILLLSYSDPLASNLKIDSRYDSIFKKLYGQPFKAKKSKKKDLLDLVTAEEFKDKLLAYIEENEPYLNPGLSLRDLANQIEIHPNQLSWLINNHLSKKFNHFINFYRLQHFKKLAVNPKNDHISIIGLAYESGFNSKTVFNTFFKKEEGQTPVEYLKIYKQQE